MGVREMDRFLEQWQMDAKALRRRMILAPTPRERERWYAILLLAQGWTAAATAEALERDPHTIGRWAAAFGEGGPGANPSQMHIPPWLWFSITTTVDMIGGKDAPDHPSAGVPGGA